MSKIVLGFTAHVDSGKTTLSEAVLFQAGSIRKLGRVDHKDAFLDTNSVEKDRGITVFSKEARFSMGENDFVILDTPGHRDFSTEMERVLSVLDYAILIISGTEGVQSHTYTLWKLLKNYNLPAIIFVNKMDMDGADEEKILSELRESFEGNFVKFSGKTVSNQEELAMSSEALMEKYLEGESASKEEIAEAIKERECFPVLFGSALKMEGIEELLEFVGEYANEGEFPDEFSARVFKITHDKKGVRETRLRVLGGTMKAKDNILVGSKKKDSFSDVELESANYDSVDEDDSVPEIYEKIEQLREYSGDSFESISEAKAGDIVTVTGLDNTYIGQGLGTLLHEDSFGLLEPPLTYRMHVDTDPQIAIKKLEVLMDEDPSLGIYWNEELREIQVSVMGELELEILKTLIHDRLGMEVSFGQGNIVYKETLTEPVIGVGHFEPLRHYAEVQLLLTPNERGTGLRFDSLVKEDDLKLNWQRLITTHLMERKHKGTLTRSEVTDLDISIVSGRAHLKHTMGGDFRQATYRALRHGLRKAREEGKMLLLEPMYRFTLDIPQEAVGRALTDMDRLCASVNPPEMNEKGWAVISGTGPVSTLYDYPNEVNKYTGGLGKFTALLSGYMPCHNQDEVVEKRNYNPDTDKFNPCGSVFCTHGAGTYIPWDEVEDMAHTTPVVTLSNGEISEREPDDGIRKIEKSSSGSGEKELKEIFEKTYGKSKRDEQYLKDRQSKATHMGQLNPDNFPKPNWKGSGNPTHLIIDGYNVVFGWDELKDMASFNFDSAREVLIDVLQNYIGYKKVGVTLVFDGYKAKGNPGSEYETGNLKVVYTREGQTADRYIEEMVYDMGKEYDLTVVTSDLPVQMMSLGDGAKRLSIREFHEELLATNSEIRDKLMRQAKSFNRPFEGKL